MDKTKRDRAQNFSLRETNLLTDLVVKYRNILENKKTDACTWREKEVTCQKLCIEFNSSSQGPPRTFKCLRSKYETLKKKLRKKAAAKKLDIALTGGGKDGAEDFTSAEEKIYGIIQLSVDGLPPHNDDDCRLQEMANLENLEIVFEERPTRENTLIEEQEEVIDDNEEKENDATSINQEQNWSKWNPTLLRKPKSQQLQAKRRRLTKTTNLDATKKVSLLATSKLELLDIQKEALRQELKFGKLEEELKLQKLKRDLEIAEIELETKKIEKKVKEQALKKILESNSILNV